MAEHTFLLLPSGAEAARRPRSGAPPNIEYPQRARQISRIRPQFTRLQRQFDAEVARLRGVLPDADIEQVVVLETVGDVADFYRAVERAGLQFLLDVDGTSVATDRDFGFADQEAEGELPTKLFLILTDQRAIAELLRLWGIYREAGRAGFPRGLKRWADVFGQLRQVRLWGLQDRLDEHTRSHWQNAIDGGLASVRTEIDVWFSSSDQRNVERKRELSALLLESNSRLIDQVEIPAIRYQGILADIPIGQIAVILRGGQSGLSAASQVMYFRPQLRGMTIGGGQERETDAVRRPVPTDDPVVAILDGVPLENHELLGPRITVVDPNNCVPSAQASDRIHGTSIASIVLHGDLSGPPATIPSRVACCPILVPDPTSPENPKREITPPDRLLIDVIHTSVRHLLDPQGASGTAVPSVRVIQFAIGDLDREFVREISPLARLIDWLSWKYRVVFIVPTGNRQDIVHGIEMQAERRDFAQLTVEQRQAECIQAIEKDSNSRILSPGESMNAITVGGVYDDNSRHTSPVTRFELFPKNWPAPESRFGRGFLRGIKPDLAAPSGRRLFSEKAGNTHRLATVVPILGVSSAPGIRSCAPGFRPGQLDQYRYSSGTSNSSALVSHAAAHAHHAIEELRARSAAGALPEKDVAVLIKAMLVHACQWPHDPVLEAALKLDRDPAAKRQSRLERMFGNGIIDLDRVKGCPDSRATFLTMGVIGDDEGVEYQVPLPAALAGQRVWRRLTITLAWNSPINTQHRDYRSAQLWFKAENQQLCTTTAGTQWQAARRGTVQQQAWTDERPVAYGRNATIPIHVSCAADAGSLAEQIPFGLCVSIEVAQETQIPIYNELAARVGVRVPVRP